MDWRWLKGNFTLGTYLHGHNEAFRFSYTIGLRGFDAEPLLFLWSVKRDEFCISPSQIGNVGENPARYQPSFLVHFPLTNFRLFPVRARSFKLNIVCWAAVFRKVKFEHGDRYASYQAYSPFRVLSDQTFHKSRLEKWVLWGKI